MFDKADSLLLENRSSSQLRTFKIFEEQQVFPARKARPSILQSLDSDEKHEECDYETEEEHVVKARDLMLEDLFDSIKFFVENQPLDLINNLN